MHHRNASGGNSGNVSDSSSRRYEKMNKKRWITLTFAYLLSCLSRSSSAGRSILKNCRGDSGMLSSSDEDDAHKKTAATNRSLLRKANYHHQLSPKPSSEGAVSKHRAAAAAAAAMSDPCGDIGDGKITLVVDDTRFAYHNIHLRLFLTSSF